MTADLRSKIQMSLDDVDERITAAKEAIAGCFARGLAWTHPNMLGHRARLEKAIAERATLELLLGPDGAR